jgi:uncharacterized protein (DUF58 family)
VRPTPLSAALMGAVALSAFLLPTISVLTCAALVLVAMVVDAWQIRAPAVVDRSVPRLLSRGVPSQLLVRVQHDSASRLRVRQPVPADLHLEPSAADGDLIATITARRRGRHRLPPVVVRAVGPLRLATVQHDVGDEQEVLVYPDLPAAQRIAEAVVRGRFRETGQLPRGPLGLGTEFESIRDYQPDDDIRQVNWRATARMGRPMSNRYRTDRERDIVFAVDAGRLMAAPLGDLTRLDAAIDAVAVVAAVADALGDRCGIVAFRDRVVRQLPPRRSGGESVLRVIYDVEPGDTDSDYEAAFRVVCAGKRALVLLFTDLLDEAAAAAMLAEVPVLLRRNAVIVAGATDTDLTDAVTTDPKSPLDVYRATAALDLLDARARVAARLRRAGADVVEAPPHRLGAACTTAYLRAKELSRL